MAARKKNTKNKIKKKEDNNGDVKAIIYIALGIILGIALYSALAGA
jgi:S-DNA-T family DNA segregation ATPase FtsK/SpoIIIE